MHRALAATALALACAACSEGEPSTSPTPTPSPSPSVPTAVATYDAQEQAAYAKALTDFHAFVARSAKISEAGKTTKNDLEFLKQWSSDWQAYSITLTRLQEQGITVVGTPTVVSEKPMAIDLAGQPATIELEQCLDQTDVKVLKDGAEQPKPVERFLSTVTLTQAKGEDWWRADVPEQGAEC